MIIGIANDHRGVKRKKEIVNFLEKKGYEIVDFGTNTEESVDYPKLAFELGENISNKKIDMGILLCGTGIGMSIAVNKVKDVRCARIDSIKDAKITREHNDANVLAISSELNIFKTKRIVDTFLTTSFSNEERHIKRIEMISNYER